MGDLGLIPGLGRSLEKGKAAHASVLPWRIPWTVWSVGSQRVGHDWPTHFPASMTSGRGVAKNAPEERLKGKEELFKIRRLTTWFETKGSLTHTLILHTPHLWIIVIRTLIKFFQVGTHSFWWQESAVSLWACQGIVNKAILFYFTQNFVTEIWFGMLRSWEVKALAT